MISETVIPLSVPNLKGNELKYVTNAVETEWVSTAGPYVEEFEKKQQNIYIRRLLHHVKTEQQVYTLLL